MMISNPEFKRNLWLEVTSSRLMTMPLVLSILFFFIYSVHGQEFNRDVAFNVTIIYTILTVFWGATLASESVLSEVRNHTWDNQRMSSMSAWDLVWGKLFGSTIYAWYGAFFCLLLYVFSAELTVLSLVKYTVFLMVCGLWAQGLGMMFSIMSFRKDSEVNKGKSIGLTLLVSVPVASVLVMGQGEAAVSWYDFSIPRIDFYLCSIVGFLGWTWGANQRLIRSELQSMNAIGVWLVFALYLMVYLSGFSSPVAIVYVDNVSVYLMNSFCVAIILTYTMLFSESKDPMHYVALLRSFKAKRWAELQFLLSCWMGTIVLTGVSAIMIIVVTLSQATGANAWVVVAILLFVCRDICLVLYLNFSQRKKRSDITAVLYLALLYVVLPAIVSLLGGGALTAIFRPSILGGNIVLSLGAGLVEFILMFWLMRNRWKENYGQQV